MLTAQQIRKKIAEANEVSKYLGYGRLTPEELQIYLSFETGVGRLPLSVIERAMKSSSSDNGRAMNL